MAEFKRSTRLRQGYGVAGAQRPIKQARNAGEPLITNHFFRDAIAAARETLRSLPSREARFVEAANLVEQCRRGDCRWHGEEEIIAL
jgi:hypothetical protein